MMSVLDLSFRDVINAAQFLSLMAARWNAREYAATASQTVQIFRIVASSIHN